MVTFFVCLGVLIVGYILYSRFTEKVFCVDKNRKTPAIDHPDGVDITPMSKGKAFLIELLNIAGTGPIFGAISGALFGPIAFIWIVVGCILGGGVHDFLCGMISLRNNGNSIVSLAAKYIGKGMKIIMSIFSLLLLILVTTVFVVSPASLLEQLTNGNVSAVVFLVIILIYYLLATLLPIDKIIGKAYPIFGIILVVMAIAAMVGIFVNYNEYPLLELVDHFKDYSAASGGLPWWPFMFTTIACGAVSGFHATQTPMVAKCIKSEKEGRQVFYGAMVAEGVIALIWAAVAMAFYKVDEPIMASNLIGMGGGNSKSVYEMCKTLLGPVGSVLAIIGIIICPITSGDTALRSCRLIVAEIFHIDQKKIKNRLLITIPLFLIITGISIWNFLDPKNFSLLWNWFAWSNQALATIAFLVCTIYLMRCGKHKFSCLIAGLPMIFLFGVVSTYIFTEPNIALGRFIPRNIGLIIGFSLTGLFALGFIIVLILHCLGKIKFKDVDKENVFA